MGKEDNYYCLSCFGVGKGDRLASSLMHSYNIGYFDKESEFCALSPKKIVNKQKNGVWNKENQPLTPGYVFVRTNLRCEHLQSMISEGRYKGRILSYGNGDCSMRGIDLEYARWVFSFGGTIGVSKVKLLPCQKVKIVEGPLKTMVGTIIKPDKKGRKVWIEVPLMGQLILMSTAVEFLEITKV